jgi:Zn-dependent alcohol dehydrogenase
MMNADVEARHDVTVAVVREKGARSQIETSGIDPPRPDDVIVRVVATVEVETDTWRAAAERLPVSAMPHIGGGLPGCPFLANPEGSNRE